MAIYIYIYIKKRVGSVENIQENLKLDVSPIRTYIDWKPYFWPPNLVDLTSRPPGHALVPVYLGWSIFTFSKTFWTLQRRKMNSLVGFFCQVKCRLETKFQGSQNTLHDRLFGWLMIPSSKPRTDFMKKLLGTNVTSDIRMFLRILSVRMCIDTGFF